MSWGRDDPGFPPSPDPAAQAERYYAEQSAREPSEDDRCSECHDRSWYVGRDPRPDCHTCGGSGSFYGHSEECVSDLCALNGDMFSCNGEMQPCDCTVINCEPCSVREFDAEVAYQKTLIVSDDDAEVPF